MAKTWDDSGVLATTTAYGETLRYLKNKPVESPSEETVNAYIQEAMNGAKEAIARAQGWAGMPAGGRSMVNIENYDNAALIKAAKDLLDRGIDATDVMKVLKKIINTTGKITINDGSSGPKVIQQGTGKSTLAKSNDFSTYVAPTKVLPTRTDGSAATTVAPQPGTASSSSNTTVQTLTANTGNMPTAKTLPVALAQYVVDNGLTNLQQYDWWKNNLNKDQAWKIISGGTLKPKAPPLVNNNINQVSNNGVLPMNPNTPTVEQLKQNTQTQGTASTSNFSTMNGQQLYMAIYKGQITPSKDNPLWASLYQNGQATPAMQEAYSKWSEYMKNNPSYVPPVVQQQAPSTTVLTQGDTPAVPSTIGYNEALAQLEANAQFQALPDSLKSLFRETLKGFDYTQEVNIQNIMKSFTDIKNNTIDPRFSKEVESFTNQVQREYNDLQATRNAELEAERATAGQNIVQAKNALEGSGMTFTGQGVENLGSQSAYAQNGGAIPGQTPVSATEDLTTKGGMTFTDGRFFEGNVNQANRLMSSSSALRYQKNLQQLGQQAENVLGGTSSLIPGYTTSGNLPGSMADSKQGMYADTLAAISDQQRQKNAQLQPLSYQFPTYQ